MSYQEGAVGTASEDTNKTTATQYSLFLCIIKISLYKKYMMQHKKLCLAGSQNVLQ